MERFSALCALAKKIIKEVTEVDDATDKSNEKSLKEHIRKELENEFDVKSLSKPKSCGRIRKKATFDSLSSAQKDMVIEVLSHGIAKIKGQKKKKKRNLLTCSPLFFPL